MLNVIVGLPLIIELGSQWLGIYFINEYGTKVDNIYIITFYHCFVAITDNTVYS